MSNKDTLVAAAMVETNQEMLKRWNVEDATAKEDYEYLKQVNIELAAVALGIKEETIKRCEQVLEKYEHAIPSWIWRDMLTDILALKDKP